MTDITTMDRLLLTIEQHLLILKCIKKKDTEGARKAVKHNIENGLETVDTKIKTALSRAYNKSKK